MTCRAASQSNSYRSQPIFAATASISAHRVDWSDRTDPDLTEAPSLMQPNPAHWVDACDDRCLLHTGHRQRRCAVTVLADDLSPSARGIGPTLSRRVGRSRARRLSRPWIRPTGGFEVGTAADLIRLRSLIAAAANIKHRTALAVSDRASYFVYFGSRVSQPARARAFIDLAVRRWVGQR